MNKLTIVVPMAGLGSRFASVGYETPKPFISVNGLPMIQRVVENLIPYRPHQFVFIARREHEKYIKAHMSFAREVIYIDEPTEGAACTVLLAEKYIKSGGPLIIANSDQLVEWNDTTKIEFYDHTGPYWRESNNIQDMINYSISECLDACIATFAASHPKWSYASVNEHGLVTHVAEKKVISSHATCGIYYYQRGKDFLDAAHTMIYRNERVNGEFYVCPVFNVMMENDAAIGIYDVKEMMGLGTPEDLEQYLSVHNTIS